jgi:hypothetical protein
MKNILDIAGEFAHSPFFFVEQVVEAPNLQKIWLRSRPTPSRKKSLSGICSGRTTTLGSGMLTPVAVFEIKGDKS